jgi:hypothetical protein
MRQYVIENWCHVLASSNSMRALKMENDDRRWFYPEVTEVAWQRQKFDDLRKWLNSGGLGIIKQWAINWGNYVNQSDRAPMTDRKREMIEGSRSEAQQEAAALAETLKDLGKPAAVLIKDVVGWVRTHVQGRVFDTDYEIRRAMVECGLTAWQKRVKVHGRLQYAVINTQLLDLAQRSDDAIACIREQSSQMQQRSWMERCDGRYSQSRRWCRDTDKRCGNADRACEARLMSAAFTPGPWGVEKNKWDEFALYQAESSNTIALLDDSEAYHDFDEYEANARLIAAAPDLYNACNALLGLIQLLAANHETPPALLRILTEHHRVTEAENAVAKARGKQVSA